MPARVTDATHKAGSRERGGSERLVAAAEMLLGRHGLDGVSMRQIQLAAGSSNKFAVQYHFGGLAGLVEAILTKRMPAVDARQAELLAALDTGGRGEVRALLDAFFRPLLEPRGDGGERVYARFVSALLRSPDGALFCTRLLHLTPTGTHILARLRAALPALPDAVLSERLRLLAGMVCTSVFNRITADDGPEADARAIDDALNVAAAGLGALP